MSRTDKDRPWELKQDDPTLPGYIAHSREQHCSEGCDYDKRGNVQNLKYGKDGSGQIINCTRRAQEFVLEKTRKDGRKTEARRNRACLRLEMRACTRDGLDASTDILVFQTRRSMHLL